MVSFLITITGCVVVNPFDLDEYKERNFSIFEEEIPKARYSELYTAFDDVDHRMELNRFLTKISRWVVRRNWDSILTVCDAVPDNRKDDRSHVMELFGLTPEGDTPRKLGFKTFCLYGERIEIQAFTLFRNGFWRRVEKRPVNLLLGVKGTSYELVSTKSGKP